MASSSSPLPATALDSWYYTTRIGSDIPTEMRKITSTILESRSTYSNALIYLDLASERFSYANLKLLAVALRVSLTSLVYLRLHPKSLSNSEIKKIYHLLFEETEKPPTHFDKSPHSADIYNHIIQYQSGKAPTPESKINLGLPNKSIAYFMMGDTNHAPLQNKIDTVNCVYNLFTKQNDAFSQAIATNRVSHHTFLCLDILKNDKNPEVQSLLAK